MLTDDGFAALMACPALAAYCSRRVPSQRLIRLPAIVFVPLERIVQPAASGAVFSSC
jgi:hypothetical protein